MARFQRELVCAHEAIAAGDKDRREQSQFPVVTFANIGGLRVKPMSNTADIHVIPCGGDDWVVREEEGQRERGHYPTQDAAVVVGSALSRRRHVSLVIHELDGGARRLDVQAEGWIRLLFKQ
jgi:hypothetical protein